MTQDGVRDLMRKRVTKQVLAAGISPEVRDLPSYTRSAREAADAVGCALGAIASSLVFVVDGEPTLVMTSGRHRVDPAVLAASLGAAEVELAKPKLVTEITGQVVGGVAPVGHPTPLPAIIDEALREHEHIWVSAGSPHAVMSVTLDELVRLTGGQIIAVATD